MNKSEALRLASLITTEKERRTQARASLIAFTEYTKADFQTAGHHRQIAEKLEAVERGEITRLIIEAPPRHTKSELASRRFPAWYIGRNPKRQIICSTYSGEFASDFGREVRNLVSESLYGNVFTGVKLQEDSQAASRWHTNKGGVYVSVGVGGAITGRGAHLALIDDPFKNRQEADSEIVREAVWKWYSSTLRTRLMPGGAIVLILTRWHEDDLAGRLLERAKQGGEQWEVLSFKAIEGEHTDHEEALWPQWYDIDALRAIRSTIDTRDWNALYQQNPMPLEGNFFKRDWFKRYHLADAPTCHKYITSDYAVSEGKGDFTEFGVWGLSPAQDLYALDWWHGQNSPDTWIEAQLDLVAEHKPLSVFGEKGVIQKATEPMLMKRANERRVYSDFQWIARTADKAAMSQSFRARAAMGKVFIPFGEWGDRVINQLCTFPTGKNDDAVDVCALIGMAIDEIISKGLPATDTDKPRSKWDKAFNDDEETDSWKVA